MSIKISPIEVRYKDKKWESPRADDVGVVKIFQDEKTFEVAFDANGFRPKELKVKVVGMILEVHCNGGDRTDAPEAAKRSCRIPDDVDFSTIRSNLTSAGLLEITAKKY